MIANKLQPGDEIRVVAPSRSQAINLGENAPSCDELLEEIRIQSDLFKKLS